MSIDRRVCLQTTTALASLRSAGYASVTSTPQQLAWADLANSYYWIDQQKGVGGVYLSQVLPFADVKSLPLYHAFEKAVYQSMA